MICSNALVGKLRDCLDIVRYKNSLLIGTPGQKMGICLALESGLLNNYTIEVRAVDFESAQNSMIEILIDFETYNLIR